MKSWHEKVSSVLALVLVATFAAGTVVSSHRVDQRANRSTSRPRAGTRSARAGTTCDLHIYDRPIAPSVRHVSGGGDEIDPVVAAAPYVLLPEPGVSFLLANPPQVFFRSVDQLASSGRPPPIP